MVRLARIEGEEILRDGNRGIACGWDRLEQIERAAEFLVEHGARQVVAALRAAAEKESTAQPLVRLIDRDIRPGHLRVADEKGGRCQSPKAAADDVRLHLPSSLDSEVGRSSRREPGKQRAVGLAKGKPFPGAIRINLFDPTFPRFPVREGHRFAFGPAAQQGWALRLQPVAPNPDRLRTIYADPSLRYAGGANPVHWF